MAVEILEQGPVCDGYDARVRLADGRERTAHFGALPGDAAATQAACDGFEAGLLAAEAALAAADDWQIVGA